MMYLLKNMTFSHAVIGIALWLYTFSITGGNLFKIPKELSEY